MSLLLVSSSVSLLVSSVSSSGSDPSVLATGESRDDEVKISLPKTVI